MSLFTPLAAGFSGGILIGLAADSLLLWNGDIMGASGIVSSTILSPIKALRDSSGHWKLVFLSSFFVSTTLLFGPHIDLVTVTAESSRPLSALGYSLAGLLVGFGTKLGNGCTSGHGICGLGRLSRRSIVSVLTFLSTGVATAIFTSPKSSFASLTEFLRTDSLSFASEKVVRYGAMLSLTSLVAACVAPLFHKKSITEDELAKIGPASLAGFLFSAGLYVSTMCFPAKVFGFLDISDAAAWDPTLVMVMGGGVLVSFAAYQFLADFRLIQNTKSLQHPVALSKKSKFNVPTNRTIDTQLVAGAVTFGLGWGIGGLCPGPAMFHAAIGAQAVFLYWWPAYFLGSYLADEVKQRA